MKEIAQIDTSFRGFVSLRIVLVTILLGVGAALYFQTGLRDEAYFLILIIALVYLLILLNLVLYPVFQKYASWLNALQIGFDIALASSVVYITGVKSSPFIFLYALIIVFANIVFTTVVGYITAAAAGALYLLMAFYQFHSEHPMSSGGSVFLQMARGENGFEYTYFNLAGFLLIAMLSGYLSKNVSVTRKELIESKENLILLKNLHENILQSITSGVLTADIRGRLISLNKTALEILGIGEENKALGMELSSLMPGLKIEELLSKRREEIIYPAPDGRELVLGFSSSVLRNAQGSMQGYIIVFQDLTEVKELEERFKISEKMSILGQLGAGLAHEIRNPLSAISGTVEILSAEVEPSHENLRLLRIAAEQVQRLNLIVEDFLLLTKPVHKIEIPENASLMIYDTVNSFINATQREGLRIVLDAEKFLYVHVDSQRLRQVIWNLLINAMQAMPDGGDIVIRAYPEAGNVVIKVTDEGAGINKEIISKIFDPFFTTREVGTGLGLTIVRKVVEGYDGKVEVTSSEGEGATFIVILPEAKIPEIEDKHLHKAEIHDKVQMYKNLM